MSNYIDKVYGLYNLFELGFSFQLSENSKFSVSLPEGLSNSIESAAKEYIVTNKDFIVQLLKQNKIINNIIILDVLESPLSFAQDRLWFIENYENGSNAYNIPLINKLVPGVDLTVLEQALQSTIARHEILYTKIKTDNNGRGYQEVCKLDIEPLMIGKHSLSKREELSRLIDGEVNHVYNLASEYPIRVAIYSITELDVREEIIENRYLSIVVHHIAFDGWSIDVFLKDLYSYYAYYIQLAADRINNTHTAQLILPKLNIQYKDFALWQKAYLSGERLEQQLNYWKERLRDYSSLNLATDKSRPNQINYAGDDIWFVINSTTSNSLRELAKALGVSLYCVLLSGFNLLLRSYTNQDDIVIGTPIANRHHSQLEDMVGLFVNSLALRSKIDAGQSIKEYIQQIGLDVIEAQLHQDLPFEKLVEELGVEQDTSRHPIFQVMFSVQNFGNQVTHSDKLFQAIEKVKGDEVLSRINYKVAKFDLSLFIDDTEEELKGNFNYATSIFVQSTINALSTTYRYILEQIASKIISQPELKIKELSYLDPASYTKVITSWNQTKQSYANNKTISELFEEQAARTPNSIAVVYEDVSISYAKLNHKANQLAHYLREVYQIHGDDLIALCLDRSELMLVAILGVLKAGAAYVPMDPGYPDERITYILSDTNTKLVITNGSYTLRLDNCWYERKEQLDGGAVVLSEFKTILAIDNSILWRDLDSYPGTNPKAITTSSNLAYVIYTSGTTGKPKGVALQHQGIINRIEWMNNMYPLTKDDKILQKTPYVFDVSVWELFWANWYGATIVFAKPDGHKDTSYLMQVITDKQISILHFVPSMLDVFNQALKIGIENHSIQVSSLSSLRYLFCSGEALSLLQVTSMHQLLPSVAIHNLYGPTEASVDVLYYDCSDKGIANIYIGKPIANTTAYILDNNLTPLPIGAIGELYIGGVGLARGYLNLPELTAEKFIANPFQDIEDKISAKNSRLYKTGDLARYLADGNIEYIGRNDFQVKVRGFRIELGEIESRLSAYPQIKQAVVLALEHKAAHGVTTNSKYLVGYYVADHKLDEDVVLSYLIEHLPEYMVPSVLVYLEQLPLTINGKLDRNSLPDPEFSSQTSYIAPRNDLESSICGIYAEVLGLDVANIGIRDDFFRLGGDSIVSIQLVSRLRQRLELSVSVKDIFSYKTVERLYDNVIMAQLVNKAANVEFLYESGILSGEVPLLAIQEWFFNKVETKEYPQPGHWNQSFLIKVKDLDKELLEHSLVKLIEYHDAFRLGYSKATDNSYRQYFINGEELAQAKRMVDLHYLDISKLSSEVEYQDTLTAWQSRFDLNGEQPLYSIGYIDGYSDGSSRIFFALHHLLIDTVSWRIIAHDLHELYTKLKQAKQCNQLSQTLQQNSEELLGQKGTSYRQWVRVVKNYSEQYRLEESYWQEELSGLEESQFSLAALVENESTRNYAQFKLDKTLTNLLLTQSNQAYHSEINDLLLSAFSLALAKLTNTATNYIILEGHGREELQLLDSEGNPYQIDITRTIGWFTTMYPVKLTADVNSLSQTIIQIKEGLRSIPNKGIGYGAICGYTNRQLPRVSFNYLGQLDQAQSIGDNYWSISGEPSGTSMSGENPDNNIININGAVTNGELGFHLAAKLSLENLEKLSNFFCQQLTDLVEHCSTKGTAEYTNSDFSNVVNEGSLYNLPLLVSADYSAWFDMTEIQKAYLLGRLGNYEIGNISNHVYTENVYQKLDLTKLELAINKLIVDFPVLRSVYSFERLQQRFLPISEVSGYKVIFNDLSDIDFTENSLEIIRNNLSHKVYDAEKFPLFNFVVTKFKDLYVLQVSMDLILLDAQSRTGFFNLVDKLYRNINYPYVKPSINFKDYQDYVKLLKYSKWYMNDRSYWQQKLESMPLRLELPFLVAPEKVKDPRFTHHTLYVNAEKWFKFKEKSLIHGVSYSSILLHLYGKVLSKHSGYKNFLITMTIFNRYAIHPEVNNLWGDFTSTNLFHYTDHSNSILSSLHKTHQSMWDDINHALYAGLEVQRDLTRLYKLDMNKAVSPIVFTGIVGNKAVNENNIYFLDDNELVERRIWLGQTSQAWIDLQAIEVGEKFMSKWLYVEQLFDADYIIGLNQDYCQLIEYLADADWEKDRFPEFGLSEKDLELINQANCATQAIESETLFSYYSNYIVKHNLMQNIAVIDYSQTKAKSLTYAQLLIDNDLLARYLIDIVNTSNLTNNNLVSDKQPSSGKLIALLSEKGYNQVVGSLAIMQAGFGYLPLNVDWPVGRLDDVLAQGAEIVLISRSQWQRLEIQEQLGTKYKLLIIEDMLEAATKLNDNLAQVKLPAVIADDIAYVIFTSGSTGTPKGVTISHRGALNTILAVNEKYQVNDKDRVLALSELSFDLSVYDIFGLLAVGGGIVFPAQDKTKDPAHWVELINKHSVTIWNTVPQLGELCIGSAMDNGLSVASLRLFLLSGDLIPTNLPAKIKDMCAKADVVSLGGATEGSIWSIWYEINAIDENWTSIPYGIAMPNQKMYILDYNLEHSPIDVVGEIYISGIGVALNYYNDQVKTNASFIQHHQFGRLYKTGDLGRWNNSGYIEFIGRIDHQVKINGYRVELEEIAAKISKLPGIYEAMVRIQRNNNRDYLVGYLFPDKINKEQIDLTKKSTDSKINSTYTKEEIKLANLGIRQDLAVTYSLMVKIDEAKYCLRKSYRKYIMPSKEDNSNIQQLLKECKEYVNQLAYPQLTKLKVRAFTNDNLLRLLAQISCVQFEDRALPKYLYPSAGSSYSVRSYIRLNQALDEIPEGYYYYNPLIRSFNQESEVLNSIDKNEIFSIDLIAHWPAIKPLYHDQSYKFVYLEAGHILSLLMQELTALNLSYQIEFLEKVIDRDNTLLLRLVIGSSHLFNQQPASVQVSYFRPDKYNVYHGLNNDRKINLNSANIFTQANSYSGKLLASGNGLITLDGEPSSSNLVYGGILFQVLADRLYQEDIGSCMLGYEIYQDIMYGMVLGGIDAVAKVKNEYNERDKPLKDTINWHLSKVIPEYMLPYDYIVLDKIPLTANAKLDVGQLPLLDFTVSTTDYVAPRNDLEYGVCEIYAQVLGLDRTEVSIDDDFFRLGGDSILAIKLVNKLNESYKSHLKVAEVFRAKSVNNLVNLITYTKDKCNTLVRLNNATVDKPVMFMIHPGSGGCEVYFDLANELIDSYSCYGIDNYNLYHNDKHLSLELLAKYYLSIMQEKLQSNKLDSTIILLGWSLGGLISLKIAEILEQIGYTNITLFLLDPIILDEQLCELNGRVDNKAVKQQVKINMCNLYGDSYADKIMDNYDVEAEIVKGKIGNLNYTKAIFYKALEKDTRIITAIDDEMHSYLQSLKYNNLDKIINDISKIKLVNVENAHHGNILEKKETLLPEIMFLAQTL